MIGIVAYGAYIPMYRISRDTIAKAWGQPSMGGEKAIANYDEDSLTMAVESVFDCLGGSRPMTIDGLFFSSTTAIYKEKQVATLISTVVDMAREIRTTDFTDSLRSGTAALRAAIDAVQSGSAKNIMVTASDSRLAEPGTVLEQNFGDGAAAFLIGDSNVAVSIEGTYSISDEFTDFWRKERDIFVRSGDERFILTHGYMKNMSDSITGIMRKYGMKPADFSKVILYCPDRRSYLDLARRLNFDIKNQLQDPLFTTVGNTGTALVFMVLVAALEEAKPGDKLLLASYGDGSDAFILEVRKEIENIKDRRGIKGYLQSKRMFPSYEKFIKFRNLFQEAPFEPWSSNVMVWRDRRQILQHYGTKCKRCGIIQYPMRRVCLKCRAKDDYEYIKLSKRGKILTWTKDHLFPIPDPPLIMAVVEMEDGARFYGHMTDCDPDIVEIDLPVELTFRWFHEALGQPNYFWKSRPIR